MGVKTRTMLVIKKEEKNEDMKYVKLETQFIAEEAKKEVKEGVKSENIEDEEFETVDSMPIEELI